MVFAAHLRERQVAIGFVATSSVTPGRCSAYVIDVRHLEFTAISPLIAAGMLINGRSVLSALSILFTITSPDSFLLNMLFSASRFASSHGPGTGSNVLLPGLDGARHLLMALLVVTFLAQNQKINFWTSCAFSIFVFLQFNTVIFGQHFIWLVSIGLIADAGNEPEALSSPIVSVTCPDGEKNKTG